MPRHSLLTCSVVPSRRTSVRERWGGGVIWLCLDGWPSKVLIKLQIYPLSQRKKRSCARKPGLLQGVYSTAEGGNQPKWTPTMPLVSVQAARGGHPSTMKATTKTDTEDTFQLFPERNTCQVEKDAQHFISGLTCTCMYFNFTAMFTKRSAFLT